MLYKGLNLEEYTGKWSKKCINLSGREVGNWKIICRGPNSINNHSRFWSECKCGAIELKLATHFKRNASNSCTECAPTLNSIRQWNGVGDIPLGYWNNLQKNALKHSKTRKSRNGKSFEISIEYAWSVYINQQAKCALSGIPIEFCKYGHTNKQRSAKKQTASLDRIDNSKGYVEGNVQWVHKSINIMKNGYSQSHFIAMCNLVAQTHSSVVDFIPDPLYTFGSNNSK